MHYCRKQKLTFRTKQGRRQGSMPANPLIYTKVMCGVSCDPNMLVRCVALCCIALHYVIIPLTKSHCLVVVSNGIFF